MTNNTRWRKSSYSGGGNNDCVELDRAAMTNAIGWRKSTYSGGGSNECVELGRRTEQTSIRDSKSPRTGTLTFRAATFDNFIDAIKAGRLNS
ncbi:DUF397 domain-containing protein [Solihabitans fulvus]|uniref:DUF397 domain-containing protein n=1 Tax=Solihabitans fulvus TaxID=1892852 RepID=A0A5B2WL30_9PSEU|nr:DUF397 domain-containing protein [Solihabitans fulvus]KAA2251206.1 DUF397 domain-containing protein [Solihabitans fulvus]